MFSVFIHRGGKYDTHKTGQKIPYETKPDYEIMNLLELFQIINEIKKQ